MAKITNHIIYKAYYSIGEDPISGYTDVERQALFVLDRVKQYLRLREHCGDTLLPTEINTAGKSTRQFNHS